MISTVKNCREQASRCLTVLRLCRSRTYLDPEVTALCATAKSKSVHAGNRRPQYVKRSTTELHTLLVRGRSRTCDRSLTRRSNRDLRHCQTVPGIFDEGCGPLQASTSTVVGEVTLVCRHGQTGCGSAKCTRRSGREPDENRSSIPQNLVPREVLAPSSLPFQGSACAVSAIEARLVRPARVELARRSTVLSRLRVCRFHHGRIVRIPGLAPGSSWV